MEKQENKNKIKEAYKKYYYAIKENKNVEEARKKYEALIKGYCSQIINEAREEAKKEIKIEMGKDE